MLKGKLLYGLGEPEGQAMMRRKNLTDEELATAISIFQRYNYELKSLLGIDEDGFYGSHTEDWREADFITIIPWVQIYEILGKVEVGTTVEFVEGGAEFN